MLQQFGVVLYVYCLMPNHYHLVLSTPRANLSQALGWLQSTYTIRFNRKHKRSGHLFQGRFKALVIEAEEYGQQLVRYIHLNPVRPRDRSAVIPATRRKELRHFLWSSHLAYCGKRKVPVWLNLEWLGYWAKRRRIAQRQYLKDIEGSFERKVENPFEQVKTGLVLGSSALVDTVKTYIEEKKGQEERSWVQQNNQADIRYTIKKLLAKESNQAIKIWAQVKLGGMRRVDVAKAMGYCDGSTVTHIIKRLEGRAQKDSKLQKKLGSMKRYLTE